MVRHLLVFCHAKKQRTSAFCIFCHLSKFYYLNVFRWRIQIITAVVAEHAIVSRFPFYFLYEAVIYTSFEFVSTFLQSRPDGISCLIRYIYRQDQILIFIGCCQNETSCSLRGFFFLFCQICRLLFCTVWFTLHLTVFCRTFLLITFLCKTALRGTLIRRIHNRPRTDAYHRHT